MQRNNNGVAAFPGEELKENWKNSWYGKILSTGQIKGLNQINVKCEKSLCITYPQLKPVVILKVPVGILDVNEAYIYFYPKPVAILKVHVDILDVHGWTYSKATGAYSKATGAYREATGIV